MAYKEATNERVYMMMHDGFGCTFTTNAADSAAAVSSWDSLCRAFLSHCASTPAHLSALLEHDEDHILALACKGFFMLLLGRSELLATVDECLEKAMKAAELGEPTRRERDYVEALTVAKNGQWARAANILDAISEHEPYDAMAFKLCHALRFMLGDRFGLRASSLRAVERFGEDHMFSGYIHGCHAFALEETGDYKAAEHFGKKGVLMAPDDAWGLHAVAHVYDMTAQAELGINWLEKRTGQWKHCNNFSMHFFWHLALHYLEIGNYERALALYDEEVRHDRTDDYRDISNGTSLLVRLEGLGVDVGERWEELAALAENRANDNCVVFADLHYMHALARTGRFPAMEKLMQTLQMNANLGMRDMDEVNKLAGLKASEGIKAFYQGDYNTAFDAFTRARPHMQQVGGSHAQRDVFERMTIDAGLKAGRYAEAKALIEDRTWRRGAEDGFAKDRLSLALGGSHAGNVTEFPAASSSAKITA